MDNKDCAIEYYRAGVEKRAPKWVPSRIRLDGPVRGDYPIGHRTGKCSASSPPNLIRWNGD